MRIVTSRQESDIPAYRVGAVTAAHWARGIRLVKGISVVAVAVVIVEDKVKRRWINTTWIMSSETRDGSAMEHIESSQARQPSI